nr:MAG TPA: lysozyme family protein [Caudoviricetes sp.]
MNVMNERALKAIESAKSQLGNPYVFGTWGRECTPSLRRQYAGYNPGHKSAIFKACPVLSGKQPSCKGCKWEGKLAFDCRGFTYWCLLNAYGMKLKGSGCTSQWGYNINWLKKGDIKNMPNVVCCVFQYYKGKYQHTGLHVGDGKIIHCSNGVQWGDISEKGWTHYAIPAGLYTAEEVKMAGKPETDKSENAPPTLRRGSRGDDVKKLQETLNAIGYDCGTADGIFGVKTEAAVRKFQQANGIAADGIAGKNTRALLYNKEGKEEGTYKVVIGGLKYDVAAELASKYKGTLEKEG